MYGVLKHILFSIDPETSHRFTMRAMGWGLTPRYDFDDPVLNVNVFGQVFKNPIGMAAGFDKDAEAMSALFDLGFGCVEVGTITPNPQKGNTGKRVFRDIQNQSIINRMGFPSAGADAVIPRLQAFRAHHPQGVLGVNIGMNKDSLSPIDDYQICIDKLSPYADYITINVSSPNTVGLRDLQTRNHLEKLLSGLSSPKPLALKISPDISDDMVGDIVDVARAHNIAALIISNTTTIRPDILSPVLKETAGGLSGVLLKDLSMRTLSLFYQKTKGTIPLIAVGGIDNADEAYARIKAGASLVQIYTGLVYQGPSLINRMSQTLAELVKKDGFQRVEQAIGSGQNG